MDANNDVIVLRGLPHRGRGLLPESGQIEIFWADCRLVCHLRFLHPGDAVGANIPIYTRYQIPYTPLGHQPQWICKPFDRAIVLSIAKVKLSLLPYSFLNNMEKRDGLFRVVPASHIDIDPLPRILCIPAIDSRKGRQELDQRPIRSLIEFEIGQEARGLCEKK